MQGRKNIVKSPTQILLAQKAHNAHAFSSILTMWQTENEREQSMPGF